MFTCSKAVYTLDKQSPTKKCCLLNSELSSAQEDLPKEHDEVITMNSFKVDIKKREIVLNMAILLE
jgi:hypothetical protein